MLIDGHWGDGAFGVNRELFVDYNIHHSGQQSISTASG
jgi:hypothetical protein